MSLNTKFSDFRNGTALTGAEKLVGLQNGENTQFPIDDICEYCSENEAPETVIPVTTPTTINNSSIFNKGTVLAPTAPNITTTISSIPTLPIGSKISVLNASTGLHLVKPATSFIKFNGLAQNIIIPPKAKAQLLSIGEDDYSVTLQKPSANSEFPATRITTTSNNQDIWINDAFENEVKLIYIAGKDLLPTLDFTQDAANKKITLINGNKDGIISGESYATFYFTNNKGISVRVFATSNNQETWENDSLSNEVKFAFLGSKDLLPDIDFTQDAALKTITLINGNEQGVVFDSDNPTNRNYTSAISFFF